MHAGMASTHMLKNVFDSQLWYVNSNDGERFCALSGCRASFLLGWKLQHSFSPSQADQTNSKSQSIGCVHPHVAKMDMLDAQKYLDDASPDFMDSADVLLLLKDGAHARVHSLFLAYHSAVLRALLSHLTSSEGSGLRPLELPLQEFDSEQALAVLKALYAKQVAFTSIASAHTVALFGHKYDADSLRSSADTHLAAHALPSDQASVQLHFCTSLISTTHSGG